MLTSLPLLVCIGAGLVAGVFFAFSSFVMRALAGLPAAEGIAAMQRINVVVLNPLNKRLATMAADSVQAGEYWPVYVRGWLRWNHVRTVASVGSSVSAALALAS